MGSSFFGLNIAKTGLFVSQRSLQVVSHNLANANTPGYSRQRLDTKAEWPDVLPGLQGTLGRGVDSESVIQIRDAFYDKKIRLEKGKEGDWKVRSEMLQNIENIFNEPTDTGFTTVVNDFFAAMHELAKNPESLTTRALVRQRSIAYTESVGDIYAKLGQLQEQVDFEVRTTVSEVNGYAQQIRDLNKSIFLTELSGATSNDLRDQRNLVIDKLSELVNVQYFEDSQRHFHVLLGGKPLVSHYELDTIKTVDRVKKENADDVDKLCDIAWEKGGDVNLYSGRLKGLIDMRDGIDGDRKGIPYYMDKLNHYVDRMSSELNRIHEDGFDLAGNQGVMFFTKNGMSSQDYKEYLLEKGLNSGEPLDLTKQVLKGTSEDFKKEKNDLIIAKNIREILNNNPDNSNKSVKLLDNKYYLVDRVPADQLKLSKDLDLDITKFAASESGQGKPGNGHNALKMNDMRYNKQVFDWGSSDDYVKSLISNLGVDGQEAARMEKNEGFLIVEIENRRQSVMGVSFDEEVSDMIKFQHAYNANARMLTTMDELLDTVINRLGLVGR